MFWSPAGPAISAAIWSRSCSTRARRWSCSTICRPASAGRCRRGAKLVEGDIGDQTLRRARLIAEHKRRRDHSFRRLDRGAGFGHRSARLLSQQHRQIARADRLRRSRPRCRISSSPRPRRSMASPEENPVAEDAPLEPDLALRHFEADDRDHAARHGGGASAFSYVALRYFNVAGADPQGPHRAIDAAGHASHQGRLRDRARRARRISRSSAPTIRPPTAPASATISMSAISPRRISTRSAISAPAARASLQLRLWQRASRCLR